MATVHYAAFLAIMLVLQSYSATANSTDGSPCRENVCGRGNCVVSSDSIFGFECECEDGWKQTRSDDDDYLKFLPCVVPNCSLNYSCGNAPPPPPPSDNQRRPDLTNFDQCSWIDCGGGSCSKASVFTYTCTCHEGYYNLLNSTAFPCYRECAIGMDCQTLGIGLQNPSSSSPNPGLANNANGNPCRENVCGRGNCISSDSTFGFECECHDGWKQTRSDNDNYFKFLPCVVPNCSLNYSCANAPPPPPPSDNQRRPDLTNFDQCSWIDCGGGSCSNASIFTHTCTCHEGYYNLLNSTAFPCYRECAIGVDCQRLGIGLPNPSPSSPNPSLADNTNAANSIPRVESGWLFTVVTTLALVCVGL